MSRVRVGQRFCQPHSFMPALRLILAAELPDVLDALPRAGVCRFDGHSQYQRAKQAGFIGG
jgi:hypothetical protein